jgi:hypothetical protein
MTFVYELCTNHHKQHTLRSSGASSGWEHRGYSQSSLSGWPAEWPWVNYVTFQTSDFSSVKKVTKKNTNVMWNRWDTVFKTLSKVPGLIVSSRLL